MKNKKYLVLSPIVLRDKKIVVMPGETVSLDHLNAEEIGILLKKRVIEKVARKKTPEEPHE